MASGSVEHDFLRLSNPVPSPPHFQRTRSFRDIQGVISKINPEIVKNVISKETPKNPLCDSTLRLCCGNEKKSESGPMTIFYNGMVAVFDITPEKAHNILKAAEENELAMKPRIEQTSESCHAKHQDFLQSFDADFPITRKNSLQRFLQKRRERLSVLSPYYFPPNILDKLGK